MFNKLRYTLLTVLTAIGLILTQANTAHAQCAAQVANVTGDTVCGTTTVQLFANGSANTVLLWYADSNTAAPVGSGNLFTTPAISSSVTYYVSAAGTSGIGHTGAPSPNVGTSYGQTNLGAYQLFTVTEPLVLQSVTVYPTAAGTLVVQLQEAGGAVLQTYTRVITSTEADSYSGSSGPVIGTPLVLPLNFALQPGTGYKLLKDDYSCMVMRNLGGNGGIPTSYYDTESSGIIFTGNFLGSDPGDKSYWYCFYDWTIALNDSCESARVPVFAKVNPLPVVNLGADTTFCGAVNLTLSAPAGNQYLWSNGTNNQTAQFASTGNHGVTVTSPEGCSAADNIAVLADAVPTVADLNFTVGGNGRTYTFNASQPQNANRYYWNFGDGTTSQAVNPQHTYAANGVYNVTLCVTNSCNTTCDSVTSPDNNAWHQITVNGVSTGLNNADLYNALKVYPVPASNVLIAEAATENIEQASIFDATGRMINSFTFSNLQKAQVDVSNLANGIYWLHLQTTNGTTQKKFEILR